MRWGGTVRRRAGRLVLPSAVGRARCAGAPAMRSVPPAVMIPVVGLRSGSTRVAGGWLWAVVVVVVVVSAAVVVVRLRGSSGRGEVQTVRAL